MKNVRVELLTWIEGNGWSCNSTIDNVPENEADANEYAKSYFNEDFEIRENEDYKISMVDDETNEEISSSDWASEYVAKYNN